MKLLKYCRALIGDFLRLLTRNKQSASVLMYHSVASNNLFFTVNPHNFAWQMFYLKKKKFNVVDLKLLIELLEKKGEIPPKTVAITFDDGYEDNYWNAFPVLKKCNFPATTFLTVDLIGDTNKVNQSKKLKMLNWKQIKEMQESGLINFEPHTRSHPKLTKIKPQEAMKEIAGSKNILESKLRKRCLYFAYPKGKYNENIKNMVKKCYRAAFGVGPGFVLSSTDRFELPRNSIDSMVDKIRFRLKV